MPNTGNRQFKPDPHIIVSAQGSYLKDAQGRRMFDGLSGLWTYGAGHCRPEITQAVSQQLSQLDYSPAFQFGHPKAFELAHRLHELTPKGLDYVFFTGSGSESADTIQLGLPYIVEREEIDRLIDVLDDTLDELD